MSTAAASSSAAPAASAAPLLAFTESAQRAAGAAPYKKKKKASKGKESGKTAKIVSALAEARKIRTKRGGNKKETVAFDDDARRDYLTGFQKRKTERKEAARKVLEDRKKKEMRESRNAARQERKQRAAENVKAERTALGLESEDDDDEDNEKVSGQVEPPATAAEFESEQQHAVVTVESFDPDDPLGLDAQPVNPAPSLVDKKALKRQKIVDSIPASSRRATKKASRESQAAGASKKTKSSAQARAAKTAGGEAAAAGAHGGGRLPQRKKAARGLSDMLESTSRKARAVS